MPFNAQVKLLHIAYHPIYAHPLPEGHRFPMLKYELIPGQLLQEGTISQQNLFAPQPCTKETVLLTHTAEYFQELLEQTLNARQQRVIGFPHSEELDASRIDHYSRYNRLCISSPSNRRCPQCCRWYASCLCRPRRRILLAQ